VGLALAGVERLAVGTCHRQARDGDRLASQGFPTVLDVERTSRKGRKTDRVTRDQALDPAPGSRESVVGSTRIHGELFKLGIEIGETSVAKYIGRRQTPPSQTWRTFLRNHVGQIVAADFFVVPTATYRLLFVLVLLATIGDASGTSGSPRIRRRRGWLA
jgi:hypothetical protein